MTEDTRKLIEKINSSDLLKQFVAKVDIDKFENVVAKFYGLRLDCHDYYTVISMMLPIDTLITKMRLNGTVGH